MEIEFDKDELCKTILEGKLKGKTHSLILLAEGVGGASKLAKYVEEMTGIETRATILGHIQRGGSPSGFDRILASKMGVKAVDVLMEGKSARVIGIESGKIMDQDIDEALSIPRRFDEELYEISKVLAH